MFKMFTVWIGMIAVFLTGIWVGGATEERYLISNCDNNMYVQVGEWEYVCMKVPSDGLAKNDVELKQLYKF